MHILTIVNHGILLEISQLFDSRSALNELEVKLYFSYLSLTLLDVILKLSVLII